MHARTPSQAYLLRDASLYLALVVVVEPLSSSLSPSARFCCTPVLRNESRGHLGGYGFALLSSLSPSRSHSAVACSDRGSGCSVSAAGARACPSLSHSPAKALSAPYVREQHSFSHSLSAHVHSRTSSRERRRFLSLDSTRYREMCPRSQAPANCRSLALAAGATSSKVTVPVYFAGTMLRAGVYSRKSISRNITSRCPLHPTTRRELYPEKVRSDAPLTFTVARYYR